MKKILGSIFLIFSALEINMTSVDISDEYGLVGENSEVYMHASIYIESKTGTDIVLFEKKLNT